MKKHPLSNAEAKKLLDKIVKCCGFSECYIKNGVFLDFLTAKNNLDYCALIGYNWNGIFWRIAICKDTSKKYCNALAIILDYLDDGKNIVIMNADGTMTVVIPAYSTLEQIQIMADLNA